MSRDRIREEIEKQYPFRGFTPTLHSEIKEGYEKGAACCPLHLAAPKLLKALKDCKALLDALIAHGMSAENPEHIATAWGNAKRAIAEAEGKGES